MIGGLRRFAARLVGFARSSRGEDALAREIASHLQLLEDEYRRRGLTPDEARRAARIALGGVERTKELHREARSVPWLEDARRDVHGNPAIVGRDLRLDGERVEVVSLVASYVPARRAARLDPVAALRR